ncbi:MAG: NAD(P)/FAD-dependent oxidoreductase [Gammaproteobacteria bacterium]|nr:NAD(P)/FAD-dependent oxidoreductase [Gammaproteobacteria bacterium]MCP5201889.1 NAD(P)/FAD-dependent oxidoreductase [Gammaproteobacteria bacterium]
MASTAAQTTPINPATAPYDYEVIVIGAGVSGIYQIKRLVDLGINATVLDANDGPGGTWWSNRYPGARFDSESYTYGYSFSKELLEEWHWKERFSPQPETLRYLNYVVDKLDLRDHMQFGCKVAAMQFDEEADLWRITLTDGREMSSRIVVTALGPLSTPTLPRIPGIDDFQGIAFHPANWPHEPLDLSGKRVGIIGTGATAIQIIPVIAEQAGHLTVFQRRANWAAPLNNGPISDEEMASIRARYDEIFAACAQSPAAFEHVPDPRSFYDLTAEQRRAFWDELYEQPGFSIWLANFPEIFTEEAANAELSDYIADRIRQRVKDPAVAELLIPKDHGFGVQRLPLETHYFEAYNRDNVELVNAKATPIERITPTGLRTTDREFEFDVLIYATGFDAFTGAYDRIDIRGIGGKKLRDKWARGPVTYLGMLVHGFPNMAMLGGPQVAAANFPRGSETAVDWLTPMFQRLWQQGQTRFDVTAEAEQAWFDAVRQSYDGLLINKAQSWITGYNSNLDGHEYGHTRYNIFATGGVEYTKHLKAAADGYPGIDFA